MIDFAQNVSIHVSLRLSAQLVCQIASNSFVYNYEDCKYIQLLL